MEIQILDAVGKDVYGIQQVIEETWVATYPNEGLGITKEDVQSRFDLVRAKTNIELKEREKTINQNPLRHQWVAKDGDKVVGFIRAQKGEENRVWALYVLPEYQRKGLGKKLLEKVLAWMGENGEIFINVASYNQNAIAFYEKSGFQKTGKEFTGEGTHQLPSGKFIPETEMKKN